MRYFLLILAFCALTSNAFSIDKTVKLDSEVPTIQSYITSEKLTDHKLWDKFNKENQDWSISVEPISKSPAIAFGKPIKIDGNYSLTSSNIESAARSFLTKYQTTFNINANNLKLKRAENVMGKWYVSFVQEEQGHEVLFSEVELRINSKSEVFSFRVHYFNDITTFQSPIITPKSALATAVNGIVDSKSSANLLLSDQKVSDKLYVLPIYKNGQITYKLAYKSSFKTIGTPGNYFAYTDAHNGELLWRENTINDLVATANFTVSTTDKYPIDPEVVRSLPYFNFVIDGTSYIADKDGTVNLNINNTTNLNFPLESKYCSVFFQGGSAKNSTISAVLNTGDNSFLFDDNNSNKYERFALYHLNHAHSWITTIDTALNCMENKFNVTFYGPDGSGVTDANAFSDGNNIGFTLYQHETQLLSTAPAVLYHEYGHSTTTNFYNQRGFDHEINMANHEAIADITASFMMDTPHMGRGVFKNSPETAIREIKNNNVYPDDVQGESHYDSQIFSGAMWDMREAIGLETAQRLVHFARYGLPDDNDYGIACAEWLLEILIADDNNGDLSDGTPNMNAILTAFNNHHIGLDLMIPGLFEHNVVQDNFEDISSITVEAGFKPTVLPIELPKIIKLVYTLDNYATEDTLTMIKDGDKFTSEINVGNKPAFVQYFFIIGDGADPIIKAETGTNVYNYNFVSGFRELAKEDFETTDNITISNNTTSGGGFEIAKPEAMEFNIGIQLNMQPGDDMSKVGDKCLVTGALAPTEIAQFMDLFKNSLSNGTISATTKSYGVYNYHDIYISFYLYEFYAMFGQNDDNVNNFLKVEVSPNDSDIWTTVHEINKNGFDITGQGVFDIRNLQKTNSVWKRIVVKLPENLQNANSIKVRISAGINPLTYTFLDACFDDLQILAPINPSSVNETNLFTNAKIYPNPCKNTAVIQLNSKTDGSADIRLFKSNGELVAQTRNYLALGENQMNAETLFPTFPNLPSGTYFIDFNIDSMIYTIPLVITK